MASDHIRVSQSVQGSISANIIPLGRHLGEASTDELSQEVRVLTVTRVEILVWVLS